jgi:predicted AAA+ superfamily ATPase
MRYQPWLESKQWKKGDPKLKEVSLQPCRLPHTLRLTAQIKIKPPGILMVRGPRQVGKSTFLREFAEKCLKKGLPPSSLVLFDAERLEDRFTLLGEIEQFLINRKGYSVLLFDEITSIEKWWLAIKSAADSGLLHNALVVCTGSSSLDIGQGADLLPGRRGKRYPVDFELLPVSFSEVKKDLSFDDYLLTGGFPWTINEFLKLGFIPPYVYNLYASWIEGAFYKQRHSVQNLPILLNKLAAHQCTPVSANKLARDCGIGSNSTVESFLFLLERIYATISCYWSEPAKRTPAPRKNRKFYPFDPFLFHLFSDFGKGWESAFSASQARLGDPALTGKLVEGLVASHLRITGSQKLFYWQGKREIDFVAKGLVEVKYQEHVSIEEFNWVKKVVSGKERLTVITKNNNARKDNTELIALKNWLDKEPFKH